MVPVDVTQIPTRLDDVADAAFEFLGLGEAAVCFAVPEGGRRDRRRGGGRGRGGLLVKNFYNKGASCGGLKGHFA